MGQISEFLLILATLGLSLGHIDKPTMGLVTMIGLITIGLSTYMILYAIGFMSDSLQRSAFQIWRAWHQRTYW